MIDDKPHPALMPLQEHAPEVVRERLAQAKAEEARKEAAREAVLGPNSGPFPDKKRIQEMLWDVWGFAFQECVDTLFDLANPGRPDFEVLAVDMDEAYQRAGEAQVRLLDYLRQFPRLQEENLLRDAMTKGQLLTAAHRLKTLAAIQKTWKDPEAEPEPVKPFGEEEGTTWRSC